VGVTAAIAAAGISLQAVAIAMVFRSVYTSACNARDLRRHLNLSFRELARNLAPPYAATLMMVACVMIARFELLANASQFTTLLILASVGASTYLGTIMIGAQLGLWPSYIVAIRRLISKATGSS